MSRAVETAIAHTIANEELEREGGALLKTIALTTALFAALGAVRHSWRRHGQ